ncbi:MAG TPA: prenyltransferase/squalene oxidase repeat-containing protein [Acidimicrobiales bacterium]|nr:prenyltransferase/squalene oxidase repeat-containing protein [Acidimicrobiales bacterium]
MGPAQAGAGWIGRRFSAGGVIRTAGAPDPSSTVQAVLALAASGVGGDEAGAGISWLEKHFESYVSPGGVDDAGSLAYVILAAQAMGVRPTKFGGKAKANNLIVRLEATQRTTGPDAGLFGSSDPTYDGAFRQGLSLMALANQKIANRLGVTWLQNQQCSDGGWEAYRSEPTVPCPAPDPSTFTGPDTNSTSLAVEGLVAQKTVDTGSTFPADPTAFFESAQNADGGFGLIGASSQSPDPDSTGEVIQALVALGELSNPAFTKSPGMTPITALATFQLGCSAAKKDRGAYEFPGVNGPNLIATLQAVPGAAQVAFPLKAQTLQPGLPRLSCRAH